MINDLVRYRIIRFGKHTHCLTALICGLNGSKSYRQMTLNINNSKGSPENGLCKFTSKFPPETHTTIRVTEDLTVILGMVAAATE